MWWRVGSERETEARNMVRVGGGEMKKSTEWATILVRKHSPPLERVQAGEVWWCQWQLSNHVPESYPPQTGRHLAWRVDHPMAASEAHVYYLLILFSTATFRRYAQAGDGRRGKSGNSIEHKDRLCRYHSSRIQATRAHTYHRERGRKKKCIRYL